MLLRCYNIYITNREEMEMLKGIYAIFYKNERKPFVFQDQEKGTQEEAIFLHGEDAEDVAENLGKDFRVKVYLG